MKIVGLINSIKWEFPRFLDNYDYTEKNNFRTYNINKDLRIIFSISGSRKDNAIKKTTQLLNNFKVDYIFFTGFLGAAYDDARIGDIVVVKEDKHNENSVILDKDLIKKAKNDLSINKIRYKSGKIRTVNEDVISKKDLEKDILGVDLHTYYIASTAKKYSIKTLIIMSISDILPENRPKFFGSLNTYLKIRSGRTKAAKMINKSCKSFFNL